MCASGCGSSTAPNLPSKLTAPSKEELPSRSGFRCCPVETREGAEGKSPGRSFPEGSQQLGHAPTDEGDGGESENPGEDNLHAHAPAHGREPADGADAHDGRVDGVGGAERNAELTRHLDGERGSGLGTESVHGFQL